MRCASRERAMGIGAHGVSLRTRIAAVASVSVALAVLTAAIGLYIAVRSDLRGEVDSALRARARVLQVSLAAPSQGPGARGAQTAGAGTHGAYPQRAYPQQAPPGGEPTPNGGRGPGGFPGEVEPAPFGAASGYVQFISPRGVVAVPAGQGASPTRIALTASDRAIAARGSGASLTDRTVKGTKLRVLTLGAGAAGAVLVAQPLTEVEHELSRVLLILA